MLLPAQLRHFFASNAAIQSVSCQREKQKKKQNCIQEMSMSESIWIFQHVSSKCKDLDSSSTAVKRLHCWPKCCEFKTQDNPKLLTLNWLAQSSIITLSSFWFSFNHSHEKIWGSLKLSAIHFLVYEPSIMTRLDFPWILSISVTHANSSLMASNMDFRKTEWSLLWKVHIISYTHMRI